ncbi:MAG: hypothetical protein WC867_01760 [Candidatus Pacearchaeota archaeon]|jgi:hypothetical protein
MKKRRERIKNFLKILLIIVLLLLSIIIIITDYIRYTSEEKYYNGQFNQLKTQSQEDIREIQSCLESEILCDKYCCKNDEECRDVLYKEETIKFCIKSETNICEDTSYPYYCENSKQCYLGDCLNKDIQIMSP